jgi:3'(2'), 5'-bisphosphate nucleotidase
MRHPQKGVQVPAAAAAIPDLDGRLLAELTASLVRASAAILAVTPAALAPRHKADQSPVTAADEASEAVILRDLSRLLPGLPVVSEEAGAGRPAIGRDFLLIDPLDGTREFLGGRPEYTVNLAIVRDRTPILGVIAAPALGLVWRGVVGQGAERLHVSDGAAVEPAAIRTRPAPDRLIAALSRSHLDTATAALTDRLPIAERMMCGSALKFCRVAEGSADVYPRLSPTSEWDVAAGHAVIAAAGGSVTTQGGEALSYGNVDQNLLIPGFLAWGDPAAARRYRT